MRMPACTTKSVALAFMVSEWWGRACGWSRTETHWERKEIFRPHHLSNYVSTPINNLWNIDLLNQIKTIWIIYSQRIRIQIETSHTPFWWTFMAWQNVSKRALSKWNITIEPWKYLFRLPSFVSELPGDSSDVESAAKASDKRTLQNSGFTWKNGENPSLSRFSIYYYS